MTFDEQVARAARLVRTGRGTELRRFLLALNGLTATTVMLKALSRTDKKIEDILALLEGRFPGVN